MSTISQHIGAGEVTENLSDEEYFLRQREKIVLEENFWDSMYLKEETDE